MSKLPDIQDVVFSLQVADLGKWVTGQITTNDTRDARTRIDRT